MSKALSALLAGSALALASLASAQVPHPLPARIDASIGVPGASPPAFLNVSIDLGAPRWVITGCVSSAAGACPETTRVELMNAERVELAQILEAFHAMPRCEPQGFAPGDPPYDLRFPGQTWSGHLADMPAAIPGRIAGPCGPPSRLAWWLVTHFPAARAAGGR